MILNERDCRHEHILHVGKQMMTAARTAPKGKGVDTIETVLIDGEEIKLLSETMIAMVEEHGLKFFLRDADNILSAECIVLIGTHEKHQGLNCGHCGYATCQDRIEGVPCAINTIGIGIAIGSACATAADFRVDTRVMFSAGFAAQRLNWLQGCKLVMAIPISASSKNPFFDRKPKDNQ
ncbi:hypothetical protein EZS27_007484 [termite gut metagenome]|uniref:DUF2148 domain-containing protein n=1 Tax=termite gut metagenome TaxID=433724 RepID=A0A5J4SHY7_9ZZZZ